VAAKGRPSARTLGLVLICMVAARTAAMLFNRWCDWTLDQRNPRTSARHTLLSRSTILVALVVSSAIFMMAAVAINRLTGWLAPVALLVVFFYSVTKRFTDATHFFLGMALAIAPIGAWIAQTGRVELAPLLLAIGVIGWVAGFDLIYATQDYEFDRRERLHSLVVRLGVRRSLQLAQWLHAMMLASLIGFGMAAGLGKIYFLTLPLVIGALIYEHRSAARLDLTAINRAFFQSNAFVSVVFLAAVCLDRLR
jgi:4-hydroxybenzoate polyprenyltransferase